MKPSPELQYSIDFQPHGRRVATHAGVTLLQAAQSTGVGLVSLCGGEGWCGGCRVHIISGQVSDPTPDEEACLGASDLAKGVRLACQTYPRSDLRVDIPPDSLSTPQRLQVEGLDVSVRLAPAVQAVDLQLDPPCLADPRADDRRVLEALARQGFTSARIAPPALAQLSSQLRRYGWDVRAVLRKEEVITVLPAGSRLFGLAADIGTTKVALYLVDLQTGKVAHKTGLMNPQIAYGEDLISRINYTLEHPEGQRTLQETLVEAINQAVSASCKRLGINRSQILDAVFVGNTVMHHLLTGLPVKQLAFAPYVPAASQPLDIPAESIGLRLGGAANLHLLPNLAGYVGADHAAVILATRLKQAPKNTLAIDIGTNTEITLALQGRLLSCSCASGPAFEGAHIQDGMRASRGAIERVQVSSGAWRVFTIEGAPPVGICGSGILDVVAALRTAGVIDRRGVFSKQHPQLQETTPQGREFVLVPADQTGHQRPITISRKDINEIQLAKAAIRAGQEILLKEAGLQPGDLEEVIVAGAFGTYLDLSNAIAIGMFPEIPLERFRQVGNAAGMGAVQALVSLESRYAIQAIVREVTYIELTTRADFQQEFINAMYL